MIPEHQTSLKTALEVTAVSAINVASWGLQDSVALASLVLSVCTTLWVIVQLIRFVQKWLREDTLFDRARSKPRRPS